MTDPTPPTVKARLPRGLVDRGPADIATTERLMAKIRETYELYGFEAVETPFIEYTEALGKFLPDLDRPNEGVFSFKDDDEQWLSLRYDLTAPLARYVAEHYDRLPRPYRSYRAGPVFRNEKPGPGRFRQFLQFDADTVGSSSVAADAEICMMAADTLENLGIPRGDYVIKVNNRKILDGVMEAIGLGGAENAGRRLTALRALDKFDKFGWEGVRCLLGEGRRDESGDFTKGAQLSDQQQINIASVYTRGNVRERFRKTNELLSKIDRNTFVSKFKKDKSFRRMIEQLYYVENLSLVRSYNKSLIPDQLRMPSSFADGSIDFVTSNEKIIDVLASDFKKVDLYQEGVTELRELSKILKNAGYGTRRIMIDPSVVRGLEYYTGPVFEAELTFEVTGEDGKPIRFGSVGGGGRYDGLVERFRGERVPATGFSIGVSRLVAALRAINSPLLSEAKPRPLVVVLVLDRDQLGHYSKLVAQLRAAGIASELYLGAAGMNAQLKYADRRNAHCAVIQGSNERGAEGGPQVTIRDLRLGAELAKASKDRADYLELRQKAQFTVAEETMVAAVKEVLGRARGTPGNDEQ